MRKAETGSFGRPSPGLRFSHTLRARRFPSTYRLSRTVRLAKASRGTSGMPVERSFLAGTDKGGGG